jgi:hypothetical protein
LQCLLMLVVRTEFCPKFVEKHTTMKRLYAIISATILTSFAGFSQVEIRAVDGQGNVGTEDISGTTVMIGVSNDDVISKSYRVISVNGAAQTVGMKRFRLTQVAGWEDGLCWGPIPDPQFEGQCFASGSMNTNPWTTPNAADLDGTVKGSLMIDIHPTGPGCSHYRYYVMNGSTAVDSLDIEVCYSELGVEEPEPEPIGMTAYPNPANNTLNIATTGLDGTFDLRITDVLGKVVYSEEVGSLKKIDVSNFKNGVYLVTVLDRGSIIQTRRVVVKHQ